MAGIKFDALNSKLEHTTGTGFDVTQLTICCWTRCDGRGEGNLGRIISCSETGPATDGFTLGANLTDQFQFLYTWSTSTSGTAQWTWTQTFGAWHALSVAYDRGLTTNDPTARVDYVNATITEGRAPSGVVVVPTSGFCIGNNTGQTRTYDGGIMHLQFHPTLLSAANQDLANKYPGSVRTTNAIWWPMLNSNYTRAFTYNGTAWVPYASQGAGTSLADYTTNSPALETV